jgi:5-methylcytosine-specific restriction endonuclease McrA
MEFLLLLVVAAIVYGFDHIAFEEKRKRRRDYYRNEYLKSDAWKRKRYIVLKRDNWHCVYCGGRATQVHHKKYARRNIGKEPIEWLVSICKDCHDLKHPK